MKNLPATLVATLFGLRLCAPLGFAASGNVVIDDRAFSPAAITINQGDEMFWLNDGSEVHSAKASGGQWNSGRIQPLDYYSTFLTSTGLFSYVCTQHPGKTGLVTVVQAVFPPTVNVFAPASGTRFGQPATFSFQVLAFDSDGSVSNVVFRTDDSTAGNDAASPYDLTLANLTPGNHVLSAWATDNQGYVGTSAPVNITVTEPQGGATHFVDLHAGQFAPGNLNVSTGDTVIFRNLDSSNHTATGVFTSREALCGSTPLTNARWCTNTFSTAGAFAYFCGLHPNERGTVTVSQAASAPLRLLSPLVNAAGQFQFELTTAPGLNYVIQRASNLPPLWVSIRTNLATNNALRFVDTQPVATGERRFFRAAVQP